MVMWPILMWIGQWWWPSFPRHIVFHAATAMSTLSCSHCLVTVAMLPLPCHSSLYFIHCCCGPISLDASDKWYGMISFHDCRSVAIMDLLLLCCCRWRHVVGCIVVSLMSTRGWLLYYLLDGVNMRKHLLMHYTLWSLLIRWNADAIIVNSLLLLFRYCYCLIVDFLLSCGMSIAGGIVSLRWHIAEGW